MSGLNYVDYFVICYVAISVLRDVRNVFTFIIRKYQNIGQHDSGTNTPIGRPLSTNSSSMRSATPHASEATVHNIDLELVYQLSEVHKAWLAQLPKQVFGTFFHTKVCFYYLIYCTSHPRIRSTSTRVALWGRRAWRKCQFVEHVYENWIPRKTDNLLIPMMLSTCIKLQLSADQSRIQKKILWARVIPYPITQVCRSLHKSNGYVSQWGGCLSKPY